MLNKLCWSPGTKIDRFTTEHVQIVLVTFYPSRSKQITTQTVKIQMRCGFTLFAILFLISDQNPYLHQWTGGRVHFSNSGMNGLAHWVQISTDNILKYFLFFLENNFDISHKLSPWHEMSSPVFWEIKKNINLLSDELVQTAVLCFVILAFPVPVQSVLVWMQSLSIVPAWVEVLQPSQPTGVMSCDQFSSTGLVL